MNWYPFHLGDYARRTRHLSWDEDCAYRRLLDVYYASEAPLSADDRQLYRLTMAQTETQREAVATVLREFFTETPEGWTHKRADEEIARFREHGERQRAKANARWEKQRQSREPGSGNASAMPGHGSDDATASKDDARAMLTINHQPSTISTPDGVDKAPRKRSAKKSFDAAGYLAGLAVPPEVAADWIAQRKTAPTRTAIEGIAREADRAGWTLGQALAECCARGWQGFRAEWVARHGAAPARSIHDERAATLAALTGRGNHGNDVIDAL